MPFIKDIEYDLIIWIQHRQLTVTALADGSAETP